MEYSGQKQYSRHDHNRRFMSPDSQKIKTIGLNIRK